MNQLTASKKIFYLEIHRVKAIQSVYLVTSVELLVTK